MADSTYIYGKHELTEALTNAKKAVSEVFLAKQFDDQELMAFLKKSGVPVIHKLPSGIDAWAVHQGVVARVSLQFLIRNYAEFSKGLAVSPDTSLVLLGEIQDPQNVGAVIRSAAAFGVSGVLIPDHREAQVT